ncbi:hypothetical protein [Arenimonas daejeonensis]|uniref:hypothetical protein n=1 Tax=Arenimonas daejeonensis TaxID=370777 RepID=UPI0011BD4EA0|nr:hypothetical protein [Arenimonas daejeonensis]
MNDAVAGKAPVMAGWLSLGAAWLLFLIPFPGFGILGWVVNLVAFILSIIVMSKGETAQGIGQLVCSLVVSPIVYLIGLVLFVGLLGTMEQM